MSLPRDLSGADLVKALQRAGYVVTRQKGSHIRLTTNRNGEHHVTVPDHNSLKVGTLAGILRDVAEHLRLKREELLQQIFPRPAREKRKGKAKGGDPKGDASPSEA